MASLDRGGNLEKDILERTHILKEILVKVDTYAKEYNLIDYSALKDEVLRPVLKEHFDPEAQIRGFLRTFRHTVAYTTVRLF